MKDLKRLIKYLLFPLICINWILWFFAAVASGLLWLARFQDWADYPTIPFDYMQEKWSRLTE